MGLFGRTKVDVTDKAATVKEFTEKLSMDSTGMIQGPRKTIEQYFRLPSDIHNTIRENLHSAYLESMGFRKGERKLPVFNSGQIDFKINEINTLSFPYKQELDENAFRESVVTKFIKIVKEEFPGEDSIHIATSEDYYVKRDGTTLLTLSPLNKYSTEVEIFILHHEISEGNIENELKIKVYSKEYKAEQGIINSVQKLRNYLLHLDLTELNVLMKLERPDY